MISNGNRNVTLFMFLSRGCQSPHERETKRLIFIDSRMVYLRPTPCPFRALSVVRHHCGNLKKDDRKPFSVQGLPVELTSNVVASCGNNASSAATIAFDRNDDDRVPLLWTNERGKELLEAIKRDTGIFYDMETDELVKDQRVH